MMAPDRCFDGRMPNWDWPEPVLDARDQRPVSALSWQLFPRSRLDVDIRSSAVDQVPDAM